MLRAQQLGATADRLVRAAHSGCLADGDKPWRHTSASVTV
jgi:hypothetical protein